jgi:hypothetical protein
MFEVLAMNRRLGRTGALWAAALLASALVGCGGGGGGGGGTNNPPPAAVPTATAVGATTGAVVSKTIGAAGGEVTSGDGNLKVTVPAGALGADTDIGIQPVENKAIGGLGSGYDLTPDGHQFAQPVTLDFTYTDADLVDTAPEGLAVAFQTPDGYWQLGDDIGVDTGAKTVSATTTHFTKWSKVAPYRLDPDAKAVRVETAARFTVMGSYTIEGPADAQGIKPTLASLYLPIGSDVASQILSNWAVDGIPGGDSEHGTILWLGNRVDYLAPKTVPDPRDVVLSVDLTDPADHKLKKLRATISIVVDGIAGVVNFRGTREETGVTTDYAGQATLTYLTAEVSDSVTRYDLSDDPTLTKIKFTQWDVDDGSRVCELFQDAVTLSPDVPVTGTLFTYSSLSSYIFGALIAADGTLKCTNPDDSVDLEPVEPVVQLTTAETETDPGFQPLGDGLELVGSVNSTFEIPEGGGTVTQVMDWSLAPVAP